MKEKPWYQSKTIWLNIVSFAVLALALPQVAALVPAQATASIAAVVAVLNLILRLWYTDTKIG